MRRGHPRHLGRLWWWLVLWLGCACGPARAADPPTGPLVRLHTGMHTAKISRIATDAAGRLAITASDDKTAMLWNVADGTRVGVLRPPQGEGDEGKLYTAALSPDGTRAAVAGWTGWDWGEQVDVYLFDVASQRLTGRLQGLPHRVRHLAYSPDGRWLAASLGDTHGIRVFDAATGALRSQHGGYGKGSDMLSFSPDGERLASTSNDGQVRLYAVADGRLTLLRTREFAGSRPYAVRFSPDGWRLAVGMLDSLGVRVLDSTDLRDVLTPSLAGIDPAPALKHDLSSVAWSADGRWLAGAGRWHVDQRYRMRIWSARDGTVLRDVPLTRDTVMELVALPAQAGGGWLYAGADPSWGVVGLQGPPVRVQESVQVDLRDPSGGFRLSRDGLQVRFRPGDASTPYYRFDVAERLLRVEDPARDPVLPPSAESAAGLVLDQDPAHKRTPRLNGRPLSHVLKQDERVLSHAVTPDGQHLVLGADWGLRLLDGQGAVVWARPVPGVVSAVQVSADGRWVVAAFGDGTVRWHRAHDGAEVLALFPHSDRQRWVLWTPEGFYVAGAGAGNLIGYHVNRGRDQEGEFITAVQMKDHFYNPALVSARLTPEGESLMRAAVARLGDVDSLLAEARNTPPQVELLSEPEQRSETGEVTLTFRVQDRGGGVGAIKFYVNDQPVEGRQSGVAGGTTITRTFRLAPGLQRVQASATSRGGVEGARSALVQASIRGSGNGSSHGSGNLPTGTLHVLAVGVANYQDPALRLRHSAHDARRFAEELSRRAIPVFRDVAPVRVLTDEAATLEGIQRAFTELHSRIRPEDTLVLFLAGHGEGGNGRYTFLPWDFQRGAPGARGEGLNEARLFRMLEQSPARTLLLLDTCDAGGLVHLVTGAYERLNSVQQRPVVGASQLRELALEGYQGHGVFTAALLQTLSAPPDGQVLNVLDLYAGVSKAVEHISRSMPGGHQQSVSGNIGQAKFPLARR